MNRSIARVLASSLMLVLPALCGSAYGAEGLSHAKYTDPKGYFTVIAPEGWQIQEFKDDPRGKVKFMRSTPPGTMLLYLALTSPFPGMTELIADAEGAGERMKQKYGARTTIERLTYRDLPACRVNVEIPGKLKQTQVQFISKGLLYSLIYGAPPDSFETLRPIAMASFESFDPLSKTADANERNAQIIASKLRLASMLLSIGQLDYAREIIAEGLQIDPQHKELRALRDSTEKK